MLQYLNLRHLDMIIDSQTPGINGNKYKKYKCSDALDILSHLDVRSSVIWTVSPSQKHPRR